MLKNNSNSKFIDYKLKVLIVEQERSDLAPSEEGDVFDCYKRRGVTVGGLWHLTDN